MHISQKRIAIARKIAAQLHASEKAVAAAYAELAKLATLLPEAQLDANVSALVGRKVVAKVGDAVSAAGSLFETVTDAHLLLTATQKQVGLEVFNFGAGTDKPNGLADPAAPLALTDVPQAA